MNIPIRFPARAPPRSTVARTRQRFGRAVSVSGRVTSPWGRFVGFLGRIEHGPTFWLVIYPLKMVIYSGFIVDLPIENDDLMGFTLWLFNIAMENGSFSSMVYLLKMVIFHGYVK